MTRSNKKKFQGKPPSKHPPDMTLPNLTSPRKVESQIVKISVASASKHGINLKHGTPNQADGNCSIESCIYNINDRACFPDNISFSVDYYRKIWMTDMKNRTLHDKTWNICSVKEWEEGWAEMMEWGL